MHSSIEGCRARDPTHNPTVVRTQALLLAILVCILIACEEGSHNPGNSYSNTMSQASYFKELLPDDWKYVDCCKQDTNNDDRPEWIVTYQYDLTCTANQGGCPKGASIYQPDGGKPPNILHYELRPPDRNYLCECECEFTMQDALSGHPGKELIVRDTCSERTARLTIFHWDQAGSKYTPKGHFSGHRIEVSPDVVKVEERLPTRAQLSRCHTYQALRNQTYYQHIDQSGQGGAQNYSLVKSEHKVDFCIGEPEQVTLSPYPEKVVLSFYKHCKYEDEDKLPEYFTEEGWRQLSGCINGQCGCRAACTEVNRARVLNLQVEGEQCSQVPTRQCEDYGPDQATVLATVHCEYIDGTHDDTKTTTVEWTLRRQDYHWKLDGATIRR